MKKKLLALICALALIFSLAGCTLSTPDAVGKIGDFEVTSGIYLLAQYGAYQQAAQLAGTDQDAADVKAFLKASITTDADSGDTAVVSDYVAQQTLKTLETLAAVDARFKELGGELTEEQLAAADSYAQQMMDQYGDAYTANGIGLETIKVYERLQMEHTALLGMIYGQNGETPVADDELTSHLDRGCQWKDTAASHTDDHNGEHILRTAVSGLVAQCCQQRADDRINDHGAGNEVGEQNCQKDVTKVSHFEAAMRQLHDAVTHTVHQRGTAETRCYNKHTCHQQGVHIRKAGQCTGIINTAGDVQGGH